MRNACLLTLLCLFTFIYLPAQVTTPPGGGNQKSMVTQYMGALAHVTVIYNSPDVTAPNGESREGQIWGQLVPYGMSPNNFGTATAMPWRAGANENTVIRFSHDVKVQGKDLPAGKYGFHIIPQEKGPWTLIFSKNHTSWGSFFYDEAEDALRVETTPKESAYHEWLTFEFTDRQPDQATLALKWENLEIPFTIEVKNPKELYVATIRDELRSATGFNWQNWVGAANYCVANDVNLEEALVWADAAISTPFIGQENYTTLSTKAAVLNKLGKTEEANTIMATAVRHPTANAFQIHGYGRQLIAQGKAQEALEIMTYNYEKADGAWPTNVGMARALSATGNYKKALEHAKLALEQAPDQLNKDALTTNIEKLKNKQDIN